MLNEFTCTDALKSLSVSSACIYDLILQICTSVRPSARPLLPTELRSLPTTFSYEFRRTEAFGTFTACNAVLITTSPSVRLVVRLVCPAVNLQPSDNSTTGVDDVQLRFRRAETSAQFGAATAVSVTTVLYVRLSVWCVRPLTYGCLTIQRPTPSTFIIDCDALKTLSAFQSATPSLQRQVSLSDRQVSGRYFDDFVPQSRKFFVHGRQLLVVQTLYVNDWSRSTFPSRCQLTVISRGLRTRPTVSPAKSDINEVLLSTRT